MEIPARTEALVPGKAVYSNFKLLHSDPWSTESRECVKGLHSARGLIKSTTGTDITIRVVNLNESPVIVQEGTHLSASSEVHSVADDSSPADVNSDLVRNQQLRQHISDMSSKIHPEVSPAQKLQLEHLLFQFGDILSCNEMDLGRSDMMQHSIDTGSEKPVRQPLRKTPLIHNQIIDKNIENMLRQGLIQPAREDWASNIVLTAKKDNTWRFCVDYRQLNCKTKRDLFPLPRIDACLDALSQAVCF